MRCLLFGRRHLFRAVLAASLFVASPPAAFAQIRADVYISGLSSPLAFIQDPSNASVQYIVQQGGRIRVVVNGVLQSTDFLTLTSSEIVSGGEQGLLGLAFPPDYATSGRFYVNFTNTSGHTVVARFKRSTGNPLVADKSTRFDLRWPGGNAFITQPFSNHNGGTLAFGPDGYLYIGMGDGGSVNDPQNNAQNPNSLLGKMLRISVAVPDSDPEEQTAEECGMERIDYAKSLVAMYPIAAIGRFNGQPALRRRPYQVRSAPGVSLKDLGWERTG